VREVKPVEGEGGMERGREGGRGRGREGGGARARGRAAAAPANRDAVSGAICLASSMPLRRPHSAALRARERGTGLLSSWRGAFAALSNINFVAVR